MSSILVCPFCNANTPTEYNFCIGCNQQIKCLNSVCNQKLLPGKDFCFQCGQPTSRAAIPQGYSNKYIRTVKQVGKKYEEHTEFSVSDHAVSELAPFIVGQMVLSRQPQKNQFSVTSSIPTATLQPKATLQSSSEVPQLPANGSDQNPSLDVNDIFAERYFEKDGEYLVVNVKDFKGKNWADQQRRFIRKDSGVSARY
jgi:hypothetical protein